MSLVIGVGIFVWHRCEQADDSKEQQTAPDGITAELNWILLDLPLKDWRIYLPEE